jgi:osmotically-inducible protein OsmY
MKMNTKAWKNTVSLAILALVVLGLVAQGVVASPQTRSAQGRQVFGAWLDKQVRHEIGMLTRYGVFEYIDYSIQGTEVTLKGQVINPTTRTEAVTSVTRIEGVTRVVDEVTILPASQYDSQLRQQVFRAIFAEGNLGQYAMGVVPDIHIIVNHGNVTLEGKVDTEGDRDLATLYANSVPGVFSVTNNLRVK